MLFCPTSQEKKTQAQCDHTHGLGEQGHWVSTDRPARRLSAGLPATSGPAAAVTGERSVTYGAGSLGQH